MAEALMWFSIGMLAFYTLSVIAVFIWPGVDGD
jgi:hypothetical protein